MSPRPALLLLPLLLACAVAPVPASQAPQPRPAPTPSPTLPAPAAPTPSQPPQVEPAITAPVPEPAPIATTPPTECLITQESWSSEQARVLRTPSGRVYGSFTHADELELRTRGGATVTLLSHGLRLRTRPAAGDLPLYAATEPVFAEVLRAGRGTGLRWVAIAGPSLQVSPPADPRLRFRRKPVAVLACTALSLMPGASERVVPDHGLSAGNNIAVAASPGGPPRLTLALAQAVAVQLLARSGSQAQIAWPIDERAFADATVIGWVDAARVSDEVPRIGGSFGAAGLAMMGTSDWGGCTAEHPLLVDAGRGPERVGEILVGTRVKQGPRRGAHVAVEIEGAAVRQHPASVQTRAGASFLLAAADATDCAR